MDRFVIQTSINTDIIIDDTIKEINDESCLQNRIDLLCKNTSKNYDWFLDTLRMCVEQHEFAACVFVYDKYKKLNNNPPNEIYDIISKLHSKTLPESSTISLPHNPNSLAPRRRIHKIIKGYNYTDAYRSIEKYIDSAKEFINKNKNLNTRDRIELSRKISKHCQCKEKEARLIVTKLKRINFINN